jgi:hypothetical protein
MRSFFRASSWSALTQALLLLISKDLLQALLSSCRTSALVHIKFIEEGFD